MDLSSSNVFDPFLKPFITFGLCYILWQWVPQFNYALYEKVLPSVGLNLLVWQHHQVPLILRRTSEQPVPICFFLYQSWSDRPLLNLLLLSPLSTLKAPHLLVFPSLWKLLPISPNPECFPVQPNSPGVPWPENTLPWSCSFTEECCNDVFWFVPASLPAHS